MKIYFLLLSLLAIPTISKAEHPIAATKSSPGLEELAHSVPEECGAVGVTFQNGQLILGERSANLSDQPIYLIQNNSDYQQITLSHPSFTGLGAGWISRLDQGQWSALSLNKTNFVINCFGRKPGAIGYVDCQSVLTVCAYPKASIANGGGNFWLSENHALLDVINTLNNRGVTIPDTPPPP